MRTTAVDWVFHPDLMRSHDLRDVRHAVGLFAFIEHRFDFLSEALGVFNIDHDLPLTGAEGVHREHGRTHHPVTSRLNTCEQTKQKFIQLYELRPIHTKDDNYKDWEESCQIWVFLNIQELNPVLVEPKNKFLHRNKLKYSISSDVGRKPQWSTQTSIFIRKMTFESANVMV